MNDVTELLRLPSPAPRPQSLAFDGETLWMGSLETQHIYAIEPHHWTARDEVAAPGTPYGITVVGDELRVLCGETDDDNRIIRRYIPGHGFKSEGLPCPEDTGSQLAFDGDRLYVSQWYKQRVLALDARGAVTRTIEVPHGICGLVAVGAMLYLLTTDDEATEEYWLTRVDARGADAQCTDLARVPFPGRALAFDGERFWTNHREQGEIVAFARVDGAGGF
jgi:hypothetical protein